MTHRLLLAALVALLVSPVAHAAITPDAPACVGKARGQICQMPDGIGGVCAPARCGAGNRPCLRCPAVPVETGGTDGDHWVPMLSFGIVVTERLIDVAQFRISRAFMTGSKAEVEGNECSLREFSSVDLTDIDIMIYRRNKYVFYSTDVLPIQYKGQIYRYVTDGLHPCYARLLRGSDGCKMTGVVRLGYTIQGPAYVQLQSDVVAAQYKLTSEQLSRFVMKHDIVPAYHSPYWPREAVEWIRRLRPGGSPSCDVIRRVVAHGCDFVCAHHKRICAYWYYRVNFY